MCIRDRTIQTILPGYKYGSVDYNKLKATTIPYRVGTAVCNVK